MRRMLRAAGVDTSVIAMVGSVVDTCRVCRLWWRPGERPQSTPKLSLQFNDEVQLDLLFYERRIVGRMIDGCVRWTVARELRSKELED